MPRTARATNSCTPRWFARRTARVLLADFWYFWSHKSTTNEKLLYDSSLSEFFSLVRKEQKGQKEERIPLLISFCRLAATGANKVPRPSDHSIATATGSKRSSADSDLLLCHVRLCRTSRELTDSRKRTRSASPRQGGRSNGAGLGANIAR